MNKIGFIGGGKMATAIIKGIINSKWCEPISIFVSDKNEVALNSLKENYHVSTTMDNLEVVKNSNIILLAVKPFVLRDVLNEIKEFVQKDTLEYIGKDEAWLSDILSKQDVSKNEIFYAFYKSKKVYVIRRNELVY